MRRLKLIYIVSDIDKSLHFEWITPFLKNHFALSFILIGTERSALSDFLKDHGVNVFSLRYTNKAHLIKVWWQVFVLFLRLRPDVIHTHLWIANLVGLTAGFVAGVKNRIYTRHHATIHYQKYPAGLKWDRLNNRLATKVIAVSKNIHDLLVNWDKIDGRKVHLLYHGFNFNYFNKVGPARVEAIYNKYNIAKTHRPVIGVISRLLDWKGVQYIIPAFQKLRLTFPDAHLVLANAHGDHEAVIDDMLAKLPAKVYTKIRFEEDLAALYRIFDLFVHVPVDPHCEAFGQTYIESLIVGIPSIFTLSGIAREFVSNEKNALVVGFHNSGDIEVAMRRILENQQLRTELSENGRESVACFSIENYLQKLMDLYIS